jgi:hypothetical protein
MKILLSLILVAAMQAAAPSNVQIVSREMSSGIEDPKQAVVKTAAEWETLWRQHAGNQPLPKVDFGSRMVVAVFLGTRPSAGYAVDITALREANGALIVEWQERRPSRDAVSAQVLTSPAVIATVPKFAGEIKFEKAER